MVQKRHIPDTLTGCLPLLMSQSSYCACTIMNRMTMICLLFMIYHLWTYCEITETRIQFFGERIPGENNFRLFHSIIERKIWWFTSGRQASFVKPLMAEQRRHVSCVGDGGNWTHAVKVRMWLDPDFALTTQLRGLSGDLLQHEVLILKWIKVLWW